MDQANIKNLIGVADSSPSFKAGMNRLCYATDQEKIFQDFSNLLSGSSVIIVEGAKTK